MNTHAARALEQLQLLYPNISWSVYTLNDSSLVISAKETENLTLKFNVSTVNLDTELPKTAKKMAKLIAACT